MPLDRHTELLQPGDQQPLVLVLRIDLDEWIGRQALADAREDHPRGSPPERPEVDGRHSVTTLDHRGREIELPVQLESPGLHRERARGGAGRIGPVDDPHADTLPGEPQGQHESGGTGAGDENLGARHPPARSDRL